MLKRALRVLFLLSLMVSPALAAGTINFSLSQQLDQFGTPLGGCQLFIIQAGTTATPQNAFQDTALTLPLPNPIICDAAGRLPQFFLADGLIKIRLTDRLGNPQTTADNILVIGPSSGGGGGGSIDPTTIAATGDLKAVYGTQVISGWVRANGRTIGNVSSGATERASADTQALFQYLWTTDPGLTVSGGRGGSAAADFAANKTIAVPDWRGRTIAGLDTMGNAAAGILTTGANGFGRQGNNPTVLGASAGLESNALATTNLPAQTPSGTIALGTFQFNVPSLRYNITGGTGAGISLWGTGGQGLDFNQVIANGTATFTGTAFAGQNSTPFPAIAPTRVAGIYIKL